MHVKVIIEQSKKCTSCESLLINCGVVQVVDVGSGKGYLSECLARICGVSVVGLDSQTSNTEGALKRKKKVIDVEFHPETANHARFVTLSR